MFIVGLTGGIASGKSTVSAMLQELGAVIIDADQIATQLEAKPQIVWQEIKANFGEAVLGGDGEIDRKALGDKVFNNPKALELLNSIVHPRVLERCRRLLQELNSTGTTQVAVIDAALLLEAHMTPMVDAVWLVAVSRDKQIERLMNRNKFNRAEAKARLASQMPLADKLQYADKVIDNNGSIEQTKQQVTNLWHNLLRTIALRENTGGLDDH